MSAVKTKYPGLEGVASDHVRTLVEYFIDYMQGSEWPWEVWSAAIRIEKPDAIVQQKVSDDCVSRDQVEWSWTKESKEDAAFKLLKRIREAAGDGGTRHIRIVASGNKGDRTIFEYDVAPAV